jgi:hypothetical protein
MGEVCGDSNSEVKGDRRSLKKLEKLKKQIADEENYTPDCQILLSC